MGQSLKEDFKLDIHKEMDLLEKKLAELQAMNVDEYSINVDENATKFAMKDYGMERFTKFLLCCFSFILL
jgi:hypothetical protein